MLNALPAHVISNVISNTNFWDWKYLKTYCILWVNLYYCKWNFIYWKQIQRHTCSGEMCKFGVHLQENLHHRASLATAQRSEGDYWVNSLMPGANLVPHYIYFTIMHQGKLRFSVITKKKKSTLVFYIRWYIMFEKWSYYGKSTWISLNIFPTKAG